MRKGQINEEEKVRSTSLDIFLREERKLSEEGKTKNERKGHY